MNDQNKRILPTLAFTITLILSACGGQGGETIEASGVIEVNNVVLSAEVGGQIAEILASEGDEVEAGQILVQIESDLLEAQLALAEAQLGMAQASYAQIKAASEVERLAAQQQLDDLNANASVAVAQKQLEVSTLQDEVEAAQRHLNTIERGGKTVDIESANANVVLVEKQLDDAREDFEDYANKPETNLTRATFQLKLNEAQDRYDDAVRLLNNLEADPNGIDLAIAQANFLLAESRLLVAQDELEQMDGGPDPDELAIAEAQLQTVLSTVALAQSQVDAAEAGAEILRVQVQKTAIRAPFDGLILNSLVDVGETIFAGSPIVQLADPQVVTITVYVPEDRYGQISVGDIADLTVDSFEDQIFKATVSTIADQAEYTPRNVQAEEDRRTTVYAIELIIQDDEGLLKSGMPGDVVFYLEEQS